MPPVVKHAYACLCLLLAAPSLALAQSLTFTALPPMPDGGRYGMGYCQDQAAFYTVGGGSPASAYTSTVFRYAPATNTWGPGVFSTGQVTPQRFGTAAIITPNTSTSLLYTLNAGTPTTPTTMQSVRVSDGLLASDLPNPTPAASAGVAVWNGKLYAYGGQTASGYTNQLRIYDPAANSWTAAAPLPEAKTTYGAAVNGKIYAFGGYNGVVNSNRVDAYDIATNTWQAQGTLPTTVSNQAVAVQGEWVWLVGDFTNQSYLAAYNTRTGQLRTFTSNLPPRRNAAAAIYNNFLYVWGGNTASSNASTLADLWRADVGAVLAAGAAALAPVLSAAPNPSAAGRATLALPSGVIRLEVFDALGRVVLTAAPAAGARTWPLDLRGQPAGIYLARVRTAAGSARCRVVRE